jgi:catechol 2,3-dioxygenase-like lactoylglutathione lyase family enzyme
MRLTCAVIFVTDVERASAFYAEILGLEVEINEPDARLLMGPLGDRIVLRARPGAERVGGTIGVQYLVWAAQDAEDLARAEDALKRRDAYVQTSRQDGVTIVEGHDPDRSPILLSFPMRAGTAMKALPTRVYSY